MSAGGQGYDWRWLARGARAALSLPAVIMAFSFMGFGALLHAQGVPLAAGLAQDAFVWALPGQVVLTDAISRGVAWPLAALAVTLTAVRLLPMVVLVLARARMPGAARWPEFVAAHFIAATVWVMSEMHFSALPRAGRLPWLIGLGAALSGLMIPATILGHVLTGVMPPLLAMALVLFTPAFFLLALMDGARMRMDWLAMALGAAIGPLAHLWWPSLDLLLAGLLGGTLAFALGRGRGRKEAGREG